MAKWHSYFVREQVFMIEVEAETELHALGNAEAVLLKHSDPMQFLIEDCGFEPDYATEAKDT